MIRVPAWVPRPSRFTADPLGHVLNQLGHMGIGLVAGWLLGPAPVLVGYLVWEIWHLTEDGRFWDGVEDVFFVYVGKIEAI